MIDPTVPDGVKMRLPQVVADAECEAAFRRYDSMSQTEASLKFSYEAQGYVKSRVKNGSTVKQAIAHVLQLTDMIAKAQRSSTRR